MYLLIFNFYHVCNTVYAIYLFLFYAYTEYTYV